MKPFFAIARLTWTELLRDRFVALFGFVALLLSVLSMFLGSLSLDEQKRMLVHFGFSGFQITLVCLSLFIGAWGLQKELDRQTCLLVLSRPVSRAQFLMGKWAGAVCLILLFWALCGCLHLLLLEFEVPFSNYFFTHLTLLVEAVFLLSLALFCSSFLRPLLSLATSLTFWLAGHWRSEIAFFAKKSGSGFFKSIVPWADWIFPPLDRLDVRTLHFVEAGDTGILFWPILHLFFWTALLLFFAQLIWRRRDLV